MDKPLVSPLSDTLVMAPEHLSTVWSMPDNIQHQPEQRIDILAMPEGVNTLPEWLRLPLCRFLRLKQRNWPAKTVQRSTKQLFSRLNHMFSFFIQHYAWDAWQQLSSRWFDAYIDTRLREGIVPATINWDLIHFRALCLFLIDDGFDVPLSITKLKLLDTPRRLPRPLSLEQVRQVENCIQNAILTPNTDFQRELAIRDLACFYLLWHCGLRSSEVCALQLNDLDMQAAKIFIRNSKERKDRITYMSDTTALAVQQHLDFRLIRDPVHLFPTPHGILHTRALQRRLAHYQRQCGVPITAQRLRHTFASQMLSAGMPVSSLQRYLGHEHLDTTMIYAEVSDPLLRQDYYQGIAALDPSSEKLSANGLASSQQDTLRQLVEELKTQGLDSTRHDEILNQMQHILGATDMT
jgi:integrase